jgi:hypothetical protein
MAMTQRTPTFRAFCSSCLLTDDAPYHAEWSCLGPGVDETSLNDVDIQYARYLVPRYYLEAMTFSSDVYSRKVTRFLYSRNQATSNLCCLDFIHFEQHSMAFNIPTMPTFKAASIEICEV